jgi:ribonuclease E
LRPSLAEINFEKCPHCYGTGFVRSPDSAALSVLRAIEEEAIRGRSGEITMHVPSAVAVYILNHKRDVLTRFETHYNISLVVLTDDTLPPPGYKMERAKARTVKQAAHAPAVNSEEIFAETEREIPAFAPAEMTAQDETDDEKESRPDNNRRGRRRFRKNDRDRSRGRHKDNEPERATEANGDEQAPAEAVGNVETDAESQDSENQRRRRRGRRGGRRRNFDRRDRGENVRGEQPAQEPSGNVAAPINIHDLDTTPRPVSEDRPLPAPQPRNYEVVNPPTDSPKAGWWKRITGQ